jgi:lipopolysaccharide export system protein LptA|tara:strand:+ start:925 stop:1296 length:372 start_codon:yes stop_codon:yes gene_type:complete
MFYRLIIILFSFDLASQEYEITSENIEIDTELNTINYQYNVVFKSDDIFFTADELKLNQNNESFIAYGFPIRIKFYDGIEFIEGEAEMIEIDSEVLKLSKNVSIIKSGNKINSENMTIKLSND